MKHLAPITRILLGLVFLVFAANYFVPFLPPQPPLPPEGMTFIVALAGSGLITLVKVLELAAAVALLTNVFVPLALAVLAPIVVGIVFFHAVIVGGGLPLAFGVLALELVVAWSYRSAFASMLRVKVAPDPAAAGVRVPALAVR